VGKQKLSTWHTGVYETFHDMYVTTVFFNGMQVNHSLTPQRTHPPPKTQQNRVP
jgi:hypothetical protein